MENEENSIKLFKNYNVHLLIIFVNCNNGFLWCSQMDKG